MKALQVFKRGFAQVQKQENSHKYKGALLSILNGSGRDLGIHELDNNIDDYHRVRDEHFIPRCEQAGPMLFGFPKRIGECIRNLNHPEFDRWTFLTELSYRLTAPQEKQTEENVRKMYHLRAAVDLTWRMTALLDDITGDAEPRKTDWHKVCDGGLKGALCDVTLLGQLPLWAITKGFKGDPCYQQLLETFIKSNIRILIGQIIDKTGVAKNMAYHHNKEILARYKGGDYFSLNVVGLLHAGIRNEAVIDQMSLIFHHFGKFYQIWDDFATYIYSETMTGKPAKFENCKPNWLSSTVIDFLGRDELSSFQKCFGSNEPDKVETIKKLFKSVDLNNEYLNQMKAHYLFLMPVIECLPEERLKKVCLSFMNWMVLDLIKPSS